jgi:tRNA threonylcarbamoyladenosine biosynthesis protein TsaB
MVICIETATNLCSVALCDSAGVISLKESSEEKSHASLVTVFIEDILKENGIRASHLEAIAVSKGPGSYTGLRIGVSVAKGVAYAAFIPLIGIDTTLSMFRGLSLNYNYNPGNEENILFCPMLDARRMEIYYAIYDARGETIKAISAEIIGEDSFRNIPESQRIIFFGDGAAKCKDVITRENITFADEFRISAAYMQKPVFQAIKNKRFEDIAYFEPFYLKDFITSTPKKNILGV